MLVNEIPVNDMVGIEPALEVRLLVGKLALLEMVEEPFMRHHMGGIEGTLHRFPQYLTHQVIFYNRRSPSIILN